MNYGVVLGGTEFQYGLAIALERRGIIPIILDRDNNCYLSKKYNNFINTDISNPKACFESIKDFNIKGCYTSQSDIGVPTQGYINSIFNLNGINFNDAQSVSNKFLFREKMNQYNIKQPKYLKCIDKDSVKKAFETIGSPLILKPVDSSGSRGISIINNQSEIDNAIEKIFLHTREEYFIVEEYIEGIEYGAQVISTAGKINYMFIHADWTLKNIPVGHSMPVEGNSSIINVLGDTTSKAVKALGYTGPSNVDLLLNKKGEALVLEVGARIGATCLPELVQMATDQNLYQLQVDLSLGNIVLNENIQTKQVSSGVRIITSLEKIEIDEIMINSVSSQLEEIKHIYNLKEIKIDNKNAKFISALNSGVDRFGSILLKDSKLSQDEIKNKLDEVNSSIIKLFKEKC